VLVILGEMGRSVADVVASEDVEVAVVAGICLGVILLG